MFVGNFRCGQAMSYVRFSRLQLNKIFFSQVSFIITEFFLQKYQTMQKGRTEEFVDRSVSNKFRK